MNARISRQPLFLSGNIYMASIFHTKSWMSGVDALVSVINSRLDARVQLASWYWLMEMLLKLICICETFLVAHIYMLLLATSPTAFNILVKSQLCCAKRFPSGNKCSCREARYRWHGMP